MTVTDRTSDLLAENIYCAIRSSADDPGLISRLIGQSRCITCATGIIQTAHFIVCSHIEKSELVPLRAGTRCNRSPLTYLRHPRDAVLRNNSVG